jgi:hypothetical protein
MRMLFLFVLVGGEKAAIVFRNAAARAVAGLSQKIGNISDMKQIPVFAITFGWKCYKTHY